MKRLVGVAAAAATVVAMAAGITACGADDDAPDTAVDSAETADPGTSVDPTPAPTPAPSSDAAPSQPTKAPPSAPVDPADLESVKADVETVAVSLESFYRGTPYPETAAEVIDTLAEAGLSLSPGNSIGGYVYDPATVEFTLCIERDSGAWATYDTAPMTLRENGVSGGCPFD